jgi:3-oxochol-4-en-24-oyl-CoA dehydrogenase
MPLPISDDHIALAEVARSFLARHNSLGAARATLDRANEENAPFWAELAGLGWTGLHVEESLGGQGYGLEELCVVVEELGRVVAPVPFLPTVLASAVLANAGPANSSIAAHIKALSSGSAIGALGLGGGLTLEAGTLNGDAGVILGAGSANVLVLAVGEDLVVVDRSAKGIEVTPTKSLDTTLRYARVSCSEVAVADNAVVRNGRQLATRVARVLVAADAIGGARACLEAAVEYAKVRVQFGRTIATFQAVKHHAANMLVQIELATASTWDAARHALTVDPAKTAQADLAASEASLLGINAYLASARKNIQLHGGIGFTWEHDAHLYLRRAQSIAVAYTTASSAEANIADALEGGIERSFGIDLPAEAETFRTPAREAAAKFHALPEAQRRDHLVDSGYLVPHWPKPYGRAAGAIEQLVIEEEFATVPVPNMGITGWNMLTILQHGTEDQIAHWADDALRGKAQWAQLFSEPDAGSDAAAIKTRGVRVEGGWKVTGQKVWTSGAMDCQKGFATVRTDFDGPKHQGVTMMVIDLKAKGVEIRPLREITGESLFNEVFFDDVFVPDDDVVGPVGQGWTVARATLGNERVSIGAGSRNSLPAAQLFELIAEYAPGDPKLRQRAAALNAQEHAMRLLNIRGAFRAVVGAGPGPEGALTKLLSAEHAQAVTELAMEIAGTAAVTNANAATAHMAFEYLFARCLSIAGGTSEISRNMMAERILGMPRDPLAK